MTRSSYGLMGGGAKHYTIRNTLVEEITPDTPTQQPAENSQCRASLSQYQTKCLIKNCIILYNYFVFLHWQYICLVYFTDVTHTQSQHLLFIRQTGGKACEERSTPILETCYTSLLLIMQQPQMQGHRDLISDETVNINQLYILSSRKLSMFCPDILIKQKYVNKRKNLLTYHHKPLILVLTAYTRK